MRVVSGSARGRKLREPVGLDIRPTSDMVKEAMFDIVQFDIEGRRVLDLFAGTGQIGIEALSRGAESVVFVDINTTAVKLIRENLKLSGLTGAASVYNRDALRFLEKDEKFNLIFLDPPYDSVLAGRAIEKIIKFDKLDTNGIMICEANVDFTAPEVSPPYCLHKEYRYGSVKIIRFDRM